MYKVIFTLLLLAILSPAHAQELTISKNWDFESLSGIPATQELFLEDGTRVWLHGCKKGALLTINGAPASEGSYKIKTFNQSLHVNEAGRLIEFPYNICSN